MQYESPITSGKKVMDKVKVFSEVGQTSRSKLTSLISSGWKVMAKVKVLTKEGQTSRSKIK